MSNELTIRENDNNLIEGVIISKAAETMSMQLMKLIPAAKDEKKISLLGLQKLAVLATTYGVNPLPFMNDSHIWESPIKKKQDKKWVTTGYDRDNPTLMIGINFWRRWAIQCGGMGWLVKPSLMSEEQCKDRGIVLDKKLGEQAWIGVAYSIAEYEKVANMEQRLRCGYISYSDKKEIKKEISREETCITARKNSYGYDNGQDIKQGKSTNWTGDLRIERGLIKKLFPLVPGAVEPIEGMRKSKHGGYEIDPKYHSYWGGNNQLAEIAHEERSQIEAKVDIIENENGTFTVDLFGDLSPNEEPEDPPIDIEDEENDQEDSIVDQSCQIIDRLKFEANMNNLNKEVNERMRGFVNDGMKELDIDPVILERIFDNDYQELSYGQVISFNKWHSIFSNEPEKTEKAKVEAAIVKHYFEMLDSIDIEGEEE